MSIDILSLPAPSADDRISYGELPSQFVDFRVPAGPGPHPLVVMIHGGFWRARRDLQYAGNACAALTAAGIATANIEYRRVGEEGGGWPGTAEDALAALRLARQRFPDAPSTVVLGHSAGGHLALWLAGEDPELAGAIGLGPVASLRKAWELGIGDGAVAAFMGGSPIDLPERYAAACPALRATSVPQVVIHGVADDIVPVEVSREFMRLRSAESARVRLVELEGVDHFDVADPQTETWATVLETVLDLGAVKAG